MHDFSKISNQRRNQFFPKFKREKNRCNIFWMLMKYLYLSSIFLGEKIEPLGKGEVDSHLNVSLAWLPGKSLGRGEEDGSRKNSEPGTML